MKPFFTETKVRWSDLDANRHLANDSYMNFTSFSRMDFLRNIGIDLKKLAKWNLGPAILYEDFSFFKEAHEGDTIVISVELSGISEQGELFSFEHNLYQKSTGIHLCKSTVFGVWFSMTERKITPPNTEMMTLLNQNTNKETIKTLTIIDVKNLPNKPQNVDPKLFE